MTGRRGGFQTRPYLALLALGFIFLLGLDPDRANGQEAGSHPLSLREDAVIVRGAEITSLLGAPIASLNLAAVSAGELRPIPFQVDEVRDGQHVFDWVSPRGRELGLSDHDLDNGRLDTDDELVFMAWDLGERLGPDAQSRPGQAVELALTDPLSGRTGYAYLLADADLPKSRVSYVKLELAGPRLAVSTPRYQYSALAARGYFDQLRLATASGGWTPNLVIRNRAPGHAKLRLVGLAADFDFYDLIRGENIARKAGPVRVLLRCAGGADFGVLRIKAKGSTEQAYYPNRFDIPVVMDLPFNFDSVLQSFAVKGTFLLNPEALPFTYYDPSNPGGVRIEGRAGAEKPRAVPGRSQDWCVLNWPGASLFFLVVFPEEWLSQLKRTAFLEDAPGRSEVGLDFGDLTRLLTKGNHQYIPRYYVLPSDFQPGRENRLPEISGRPLQLSVHPLPRQNY